MVDVLATARCTSDSRPGRQLLQHPGMAFLLELAWPVGTAVLVSKARLLQPVLGTLPPGEPNCHIEWLVKMTPARRPCREMNPNYIRLLVGMVLAFVAVTPMARAADVPYISGGTGVDERQALLAKERDFNLKIVVAETSGDYLADVRVVIESAKKERVLETKMEGPILLAKLVPGTYTIRATSYKRAQTKSVTLPAEGLRRVDFRWPPSLDPEEEEE